VAYEVKPDGNIIASTLDEAIALSEKLRQVEVGRTKKPEKSESDHQERPAPSQEMMKKARAFLGALLASGSAGIESTALAERLGLSHARALSAYVSGTKKLIKLNGGRPDKIFSRERSKEGAIWRLHVQADRLEELGLA
jgi:hypothetical protein